MKSIKFSYFPKELISLSGVEGADDLYSVLSASKRERALKTHEKDQSTDKTGKAEPKGLTMAGQENIGQVIPGADLRLGHFTSEPGIAYLPFAERS